MSLSLKELQKHAEDILPHRHNKKSSKDNIIVAGTGGKTNYRVLPNLRFAYAMPLVLLVAGIGVYSLLFSQAATPTMANLWVDQTAGTHNCTVVAGIGETYSSAQSSQHVCSSMSAALTNASAGQTIVVIAGNYGALSLNANKPTPGQGVAPVTIIGDTTSPGVTVSSLSTSGSNYIIQDMTVDTGTAMGSGWGGGGTNITGKNIKLHGQSPSFLTPNGVTWQGGELGQSGQAPYARVCPGDTEPVQINGGNNITIDGVTFYVVKADTVPRSGCSSSNGFHLEMIRIDGNSNNITLKNNTFVDGQQNNSNTIFISPFNSSAPGPQNITIANNYFGSDINAALEGSGTCTNWTIAYNTFHNSPGLYGCTPAGNGGSATNVNWIGNLGPKTSYSGCPGTFTKNVWQDTNSFNCGSDKFVSGTRGGTENLGLGGGDNFHITSTSSPAYNSGENTYCASILGNLDHDGGARPFATTCDAGAHEYGSTPSGGGGDSQAPTVSMTSPTGATTVTGSINVAATASDNVGVSGVQFKVDGSNIGSEDISSPYSVSWDSTGASNGGHTLTAVARDSAGNISTSTGVVVTVSNVTNGTNLYISPSGVDTNSCSQASPCKTINGAYAKASAGNTILINDGSYVATATDSITYRPALATGNPVIVKPASGATVTFNDIELLAGNITFQGPNFNARSFDIGRYNGTRITNVTLDGLNIDAKDILNLTGMNIASVTGLTLKNSRVGNTMAGSGASDTAKSVEFCGASSTCYAADVTFEGNTFYDADAPSGSLAHLECIFAPGIQGFTVRKNRFQDCTYFDIFITVILANNQAQPRDYIIEDNLLGRTLSVGGTEAGYAINVHTDVQPNNIQYIRNTIEGALSTANGGGAIQSGGWTIAGNIISEGVWLSDSGPMDCRSGITFAYNVMPNTCGGNTTTSSTATIKSGWVSQKGPYAGDDDFHLTVTSPANNKGRPSDAGTFDFAGITRGATPDAGAYEYTTGGGSTCPTKAGDVNGDGSVNITDIGLVLSAYGQTTTTNCADLDKSGTVNIQDLSIILSKYGT